jgi:hypothetical protein
MSPFRFLVFVALVGFGYYQWREKHDAPAKPAEALGGSTFGFVPAPVFGAASNAVMIATTEDCPAGAMLRAQALATGLKEQGIPITWAPPISAAAANADPALARRAAAISAGEQPLVVIRGKAKSNPMLADIVLEYGRL